MTIQWLLPVALATPLVALLTALCSRLRPWLPNLLWLLPLPALVAAVLALHGIPLAFTLSGLSFALDQPGAMLLAAAALLWSLAGLAVPAVLDQPSATRLSLWWLPTLAGSLAVFGAADLLSFYLAYAIVGMSSWGLIGHADHIQARHAAGGYLIFALSGELCVLMACVLLAAPLSAQTGLSFDAVTAALPSSPWRHAAVGLLMLGLGIKIGLVPLHSWMPLAYSAAPPVAAAVIAGAASKAGIIGLIRLLPIAEGLMSTWGLMLAVLGLVTAFYGLLIGVKQRQPAAVLAYSSISQLGLTASLLGVGLMSAEPLSRAAAVFYAAHHLLVKGVLFLALALIMVSGARWRVLLGVTLLGLSLAGLPLTAGFLAKLGLKPILGDGTIGLLASLAAAGTTLLMLHFVRRLAATQPVSPTVLAPHAWLALGLLSLAALIVPWLLVPLSLGQPMRLALGLPVDQIPIWNVPWSLTRWIEFWQQLISAPGLGKALWQVLWPLLFGGLIALALWLPPLPPGDVLLLVERLGLRIVCRIGEQIQRLEHHLRAWPVAGLALLGLVLLFAVMLMG